MSSGPASPLPDRLGTYGPHFPVVTIRDIVRTQAKLADALGIGCSIVSVHPFPDGESLVTVTDVGATAYLYRSLDGPNAKLVEVMLAASALREFAQAWADLTPEQQQELFVRTFDLNPLCSLEVGWQLYGEARGGHIPGAVQIPYAWYYATDKTVLNYADLKTLPLGLADILAQYNINWGLLTSNTTLAMIPGMLFFAFAGRYFIDGLVAGALKA